MTLVTAANFKAAVATAAVDLTTIWTDTVDTRTATEIRNPKHALRQLEKLFLFDPVTGIVTSDDAYIDAAYAGSTPNKGGPFDHVTDIEPLALVSATVENAEPADIVLTFSRNVANQSNIVLGGDASPAKVIASIAIVTVVVTVVVTVAYVNGNVITLSGDFRTSDNEVITLTNNTVVNNVV